MENAEYFPLRFEPIPKMDKQARYFVYTYPLDLFSAFNFTRYPYAEHAINRLPMLLLKYNNPLRF